MRKSSHSQSQSKSQSQSQSQQSIKSKSKSNKNGNNDNDDDEEEEELESKLQKVTKLDNQLVELGHKLASLSSSKHKHKSSSSSSQAHANANVHANSERISQQMSKIRIEICEIHSDVVLTNPSFAYRHDVPNKMWRSCFYGRINELRSRIGKEKARFRKLLHRSGVGMGGVVGMSGVVVGDGSSSNSSDYNHVMEQEKKVKAYENNLDEFLKEAVTLYEYIVDQLQGMLVEYTDIDTDIDSDSDIDGCIHSSQDTDDNNDNDDVNANVNANGIDDNGNVVCGDDDYGDDDDEFKNQYQYQYQSQNSTTSTSTTSNKRNKRKNGRGGKTTTIKTKTSTTKTAAMATATTATATTATKTPISERKIKYVIPTLFRFYIHLGDLHRYASNYTAAEKVYTKASHLAPGKGNPYNQLAVCAQINDSSISIGANASGSGNTNANMNASGNQPQSNPLPAVALYWYCRSLLAAHDAFVTSKSNLERLFISNKQWIRESNIQTFADIAKKNSNNNANANVRVGENNENVEKVRAARSLAKRKFLSHYVDFHGSLLSLLKTFSSGGSSSSGSGSGSGNLGNEYKKNDDDVHAFIHDMENLVNELKSVQSNGSFGDAFLIKMVSINAFSVWNAMDNLKKLALAKKKKGVADAQSQALTNPNTALYPLVIALTFILRFTAQMCFDTEKGLTKAIEKQQQKQKKHLGSIRIIGPVFLLCEFISNTCNLTHMKEDLSDVGTPEFIDSFDKSVQEFWSGVASLANIIKGNEMMVQLIESTSNGGDNLNVLPDDFQSLTMGYIPFLSLGGKTENTPNSHGEKEPKVYLTPEEAVATLELDQGQSQTQQSQSSHRSRKSSAHSANEDRTPERIELELTIKLKRFMKFISKHVASGDLVQSSDGRRILTVYDVVTMEVEEEVIEIDDDDDNADNMGYEMDVDVNDYEREDFTETQDHSEEKDQDVLVYTTAESGKPALLVPGAFLLEGKKDEEKEEEEKEVTAKDSSFIDDVKMGGRFEESSVSLPNLLNPTLLLDKEKDSCQPPVQEESRLLSAMKEKQLSSAPDLSILPPMSSPSSPPKPVTAALPPLKPTVRPPPGFHSMQKPSNMPSLPPMPPGFMPLQNESARNPLPPPQVQVPGLAPGLSIPQTANPFVTPLEYNSGMVVSNGLPSQSVRNESFFDNSNVNARSDAQSFSSSFMSSNTRGTIGTNNTQQNFDEMDMNMNQDFDLTGIYSLGIFTDDRNDAEPNISVDSLFQGHLRAGNETQNPFTFD